MITPPPCASMGWTAAWQHRNAPVRLTCQSLVPALQGVILEGARPVLPVHCLRVELGVEGGAVDQDIQPAEGFQGSLHHAADRSRAR